MTPLSLEWPLLRSAMLLFALSSAVGAALAFGAQHYRDSNEADYQRHRSRLGRLARLHRAAESDRSLYSRYVSEYEALQRRGVIGNEPRLDWIEALEHVGRALQLPVLRYEIQPRTPVSPASARYSRDGIRLHRSSMTIDAGLVHEGDLIALLNQLRRRTSGRFRVRDCDLQFVSAARGVVFDQRQSNLKARCRIDWYTLTLEASAPGKEAAR